MAQRFLLDENILYEAIRGVDKYDNPDGTAAELLRRIYEICHVIVIHHSLLDRYWAHLSPLAQNHATALEAIQFINDFIKNSSKCILEYDELPDLPEEAKIPEEDIPIVRAALISRPTIITDDEELQTSIRAHVGLSLAAHSPSQALELIRRESTDRTG